MMQDFIDAIEKTVADHINDLHTAIPAEIVDVNYDDGTVDVLPKAKINLASGEEIEYPQINDVPVLFPCGMSKDAVIVYPLNRGDECLLVFCEQSLDYWRSSGVTSSEMKFSLSNAIAIPGLFAKPTSDIREAVKNNSIIIRNGNKKISLSKDKITIQGDIEIEGNLTINGEIKNK